VQDCADKLTAPAQSAHYLVKEPELSSPNLPLRSPNSQSSWVSGVQAGLFCGFQCPPTDCGLHDAVRPAVHTSNANAPLLRCSGAVRCGAVRCGAVRCSAVQRGAARCSAVRALGHVVITGLAHRRGRAACPKARPYAVQ
jgi:hypothetical protein